MKKTLAIALCGTLLLAYPLPALADDLTQISFEQIEEDILERNTTVKTLDNSLEITDLSLDIQEDSVIEGVRDELESQIESLETKIETTNVDLTLATKLEESYSGEGENPYSGTVDSLTTNLGTLNATLATLQSQYNNLDIDELEDDFRDEVRRPTMESVRLNSTMGKDMQVYLAQSYYMGYKSLERSIDDLEMKIDNLEDQLEAMELRYQLGLVTEQQVLSMEQQLRDLKNTLGNLKKQQQALKGDLNLLFGNDYEDSLAIDREKLVADYAKLNEMDYDLDYEEAEDNSYALKLQFNAYYSKNTSLDSTEDKYGDGSDEYDKAELEKDNEELKFEEAYRTFAKTFDLAYQAVREKKAALDLAKANFRNLEIEFNNNKIKYDLGMISKLTYQSAERDYEMQRLQIDEAQQDLFKAYNDYQWLLKGLNTNASDPSTVAGGN